MHSFIYVVSSQSPSPYITVPILYLKNFILLFKYMKSFILLLCGHRTTLQDQPNIYQSFGITCTRAVYWHTSSSNGPLVLVSTAALAYTSSSNGPLVLVSTTADTLLFLLKLITIQSFKYVTQEYRERPQVWKDSASCGRTSYVNKWVIPCEINTNDTLSRISTKLGTYILHMITVPHNNF